MPEISPEKAAELALAIYGINSGSERELKLLLANPIFSDGGSRAKLRADVGGRVLRSANDMFGLFSLGGKGYEKDVFLVFRGTTTANNKADFITDARIGITFTDSGLPVHIGFQHAFTSMLGDIKRCLSSAKEASTIHCIGHSLGGAVASLAADWSVRNTHLRPKLYTFGAPRIGTDWFAKSTTSKIRLENIHRVYHKTDPVPMVPLYPFVQAPYGNNGHYISSNQPLLSGEAHLMRNYLRSTNGKSWSLLSETPESVYSIEAAIENWLKSKSPVDASSDAFWRWIDAALVYVMKKVAMSAIVALQGVFIGAFTLADKLAYILAKGIDLAENISVWVERLMKKIMQALGMVIIEAKKELTRALIRKLLVKLTEEANKHAKRALRNL